MTKSERREAIKAIYPAACCGCRDAVRKLRELMRPKKRYAKCATCGVTVMTYKPITELAWCGMHNPRRVNMRRQIGGMITV